ncbi:MAG: non-homologous end-joining DNA ligase [Nocardioidaceae bacterium]
MTPLRSRSPGNPDGSEPIANVPGPALATLTKDRFSDERWVYERKLDGMRLLAYSESGTIRLRSRSGSDITTGFPEIATAIAAQQAPDFVVDGEVVAFVGSQTSFVRLQQRIHVRDPERAKATGVAVFYYVFDLLHLDGRSTRTLPLRARKGLLEDLFDWSEPLRFTVHRDKDGEAFFGEACRRGWEGIIAKRADSTYQPGRTRNWLKFKCEAGQEFVVAGWTDPQGSRVGIGALLLGYYDANGALTYAGRVGTGFDTATLDDLRARLDDLTQSSTAYDTGSLPTDAASRRGVHWVRPELLAQVSFAEWTPDGRLRHPRFLGLRTDKAARDVRREVPDA